MGGAKKRLSVTFPQLAPLPDDDETKTKYDTHHHGKPCPLGCHMEEGVEKLEDGGGVMLHVGGNRQ